MILFELIIIDVEDVLYVVLLYFLLVLWCVGGFVTSLNSYRASESAVKDSMICDDLDEVMMVFNVIILVGEWILFGVN